MILCENMTDSLSMNIPCCLCFILNIHDKDNMIFPDFAKAFDAVPHKRLNNWRGIFSLVEVQRVMGNGSSSKWSPVLSGVLQGTQVLGPIFLTI